MKKYSKNFMSKFMKLIHIFISTTKKKIRVDENEHKYITFRFDVNFSKYNLAVEIDEKGHTNRDLVFEKKIQEAIDKKTRL